MVVMSLNTSKVLVRPRTELSKHSIFPALVNCTTCLQTGQPLQFKSERSRLAVPRFQGELTGPQFSGIHKDDDNPQAAETSCKNLWTKVTTVTTTVISTKIAVISW